MKLVSAKKAILATSVILCGVLVSIQWPQGSGQRPQGSGITLAVDTAQARIGRPATPGSFAGVARRTTRRHIYGYGTTVGVAPACVRVLVHGAYVCR
jgi:hypothetical protein